MLFFRLIWGESKLKVLIWKVLKSFHIKKQLIKVLLWFPRQHILIRASIHEDGDKAQTNCLKGSISEPLYLHRTIFSLHWHPHSADKNTSQFQTVPGYFYGWQSTRPDSCLDSWKGIHEHFIPLFRIQMCINYQVQMPKIYHFLAQKSF